MISVLFCNFIEKVYIKKENASFPGGTQYSQRLTLTAKYLSSWSTASVVKAEEVLRAWDFVRQQDRSSLWSRPTYGVSVSWVSPRPLAAIS